MTNYCIRLKMKNSLQNSCFQFNVTIDIKIVLRTMYTNFEKEKPIAKLFEFNLTIYIKIVL